MPDQTTPENLQVTATKAALDITAVMNKLRSHTKKVIDRNESMLDAAKIRYGELLVYGHAPMPELTAFKELYQLAIGGQQHNIDCVQAHMNDARELIAVIDQLYTINVGLLESVVQTGEPTQTPT